MLQGSQHRIIYQDKVRTVWWTQRKLDESGVFALQGAAKNTPALKMRFLSNDCRLLCQTLQTCLIRYYPPLQCFPFEVNLHVGNWHNRKVKFDDDDDDKLNITVMWCYELQRTSAS